MLGRFVLFCGVCWFFFSKLSFLKNSFRNTISIKQLGSTPGPMFCWVWCGFKLFAKANSRWHLQATVISTVTVKSRLSERRSSENTGLFEDDGLFSLLSIAIKIPIIRISIIRKIQFFEVIRRSRLKKLLLNYPSKFEVQKSRMVIMISLFGRVRFTHLSDLANKVTPD